MSPGLAARTQWRAVMVAALCGVAAAMNVGKVPVSLPQMRDELGLSLVQAGWVSSTLATLAVVVALAVGLLVGRLGALRMVLAGLLLGALGAAATLAASGFAWLITCRIVEGAGFLLVSVAAPALVSAAAAAPDRRFALGIWSGYMPMGASIAMALAPLLMPAPGWRALWIAAACALCVAAVAVWRERASYGPGVASQHALAPLSQTLAVLRQPLPWLLTGTFALWATQHFALIIWLPTFLKEQRQLPDGVVSMLTCLMLVANVPGNLIGGALVQRGLPRGVVIACAQTFTGLCGWWLFSDALPDLFRYALCVLLSFVGGVIPASVMSSSTVLARTPSQIGALQGLIMQGTQLGQFIGTPLIAAVVAASGQWSSARWVTAAAALGGGALAIAAWRLERRLTHTALP